jgi:hypothetical protein
MILKITKKNAPSPDTSSPNGRAPKSERSGWDPFEVWRTRVLLPRLEGDQEQDKPAPTVQLVRK